MKIKVRENIDFSRLRPEALNAWNTAMIIASNFGVNIELTSGHRDRGRSQSYSKHNDGLAIDFIASDKLLKLLEALKMALPGYDVIYHADSDGVGKHFHIEWDRKR